MTQPLDEATLRNACAESLDAWPEARAALLFGSRARGDHRPDSDWDVLLVVDDDGIHLPQGLPVERLADTVNEVNVVVRSERLLRERAGLVGSLDRCVARDGRLLAGAWNRPEPGREAQKDPQEWRRGMDASLSHVRKAFDCHAEARSRTDWVTAFDAYGDLVQESADAAKRLAKAVLVRRGVTPKRIRDVAELAGQLEAERGDSTMAARLRALDGVTRRDHTNTYGGIPVPDRGSGARAVRRLQDILPLWHGELAEALHETALARNARVLVVVAQELGRRMLRADWETVSGRGDSFFRDREQVAVVTRMDAAAAELERSCAEFATGMEALVAETESRPAPLKLRPDGSGTGPV